MIPLLTAEKLEIVRSTDADIDTTACFVEHTLTTDAVKADSEIHNYASAATGDLLAGPAAGTERRAMESCFIRNKDAVTPCDVTVVINKAAADAEIWKEILNPGQTLEYESKLGWYKPDPVSKLNKALMVNANVTNATTSFADITGLTQEVKAGTTYAIEAHLFHVNNASTTGSRFGFNGPAMTYMVAGTIDTVTPSVTASAHSAGVVTALETALTAQTTGSTSNRLAVISGIVVPSADGIFAMRCQSEIAVASGLIVLRGSWLSIREVDNV